MAWLVANPDATQGGFNLEMSVYTPMVGWATVTSGPTGLSSALVKINSNGNNKVAIVTDWLSGIHDAYILHSDGSWILHENINQKVAGDGINLLENGAVDVIAGDANHFMAAWRESVTDSNGASVVRYRTAMIHAMSDATTGMMMWHVQAPSEVAGTSSGLDRNLHFVLDSMGNASAVWTSVNSSNNTDNVYVNQAPMGSGWAAAPELLASYDMSIGNFAEHASITINSAGKVGIAWDQHMTGSGMAMHHVWFVVNK